MDSFPTDNVNVPIPQQEGYYKQIKKSDMKVTVKSCGDHKYVLDPTEKSDHWQGYQCQNCGLGKLIKK